MHSGHCLCKFIFVSFALSNFTKVPIITSVKNLTCTLLHFKSLKEKGLRYTKTEAIFQFYFVFYNMFPIFLLPCSEHALRFIHFVFPSALETFSIALYMDSDFSLVHFDQKGLSNTSYAEREKILPFPPPPPTPYYFLSECLLCTTNHKLKLYVCCLSTISSPRFTTHTILFPIRVSSLHY